MYGLTAGIFQDWPNGLPRLFTDTSEHTRLLLFFFFFYFLADGSVR